MESSNGLAATSAPDDRVPDKPKRIQDLDAFRGLAILAVLLFHFTFRWGPLNGQVDVTHFRTNVDWFADGWLGVEFFFIISGFVIFMTVQACSSFWDFAIRRVSRLYPTYILCMTITFLVGISVAPPIFHNSVRQYLVGFTMQSPTFNVDWIDGAYWSLLVELKFYVFIGLLYFSLKRRFALGWLALCVFAAILKQFPHSGADAIFVVSALPFFTLGMAFYRQYADGRIGRDSVLFVVAAVPPYVASWSDKGPMVHIYIAAMIALFAAFAAGRLKWLAIAPLTFIGAISYPLYLVHENIGVTIVSRLNAIPQLNGLPSILVASAAIIGLATAIHYCFELVSQRVTRRFLERILATLSAWPRRAPSAAD